MRFAAVVLAACAVPRSASAPQASVAVRLHFICETVAPDLCTDADEDRTAGPDGATYCFEAKSGWGRMHTWHLVCAPTAYECMIRMARHPRPLGSCMLAHDL